MELGRAGEGTGGEAPRTRTRRAQPSVRGGRTNTGVRFPPALYERLAAAAEERDVSMNWIVNKAVVDFLDRLIPVEEIKWTRD